MNEAIEFINALFPHLDKEYNRKLSVGEAVEGIKKVVSNSENLLEDALILFKANRFPRSVALAIMAVEEISKIDIIKKILLAKGLEGRVWKDFKNHRTKNHLWFYPVLKKFGVANMEVQFFQGINSQMVQRIDSLKNASLYLNPVESKLGLDWSSPADLISKDFCGMFLVIATEVVKDDRITWDSNSLEIFIKHWKLIDDEIRCEQPLLFYEELRDSDMISEDRFVKVVSNYNK